MTSCMFAMYNSHTRDAFRLIETGTGVVLNSIKELNQLRSTILVMAQKLKEGHVPSSLSIPDLVWVLYTRILKIKPKNPLFPGRDRFFLSKDHAGVAVQPT